MPEFTSHAPNSPCWADLMSPSIDASKDFYAALFGWDMQDELDEKGNRIYVTCLKNGKKVAGIGGEAPGMEDMPAIWNTYIAVEDIAETKANVEAAGGSVIMDEMQVMNAGAMAVFSDPTGAAFSVWKPQDHFGVELGNENNTYSWNELQTRDLETAKIFYSEVFGWSYEVMTTDH